MTSEAPSPGTRATPRLGMGILSWRGYDSLRQALESYKREDLFSLFDEILLFLPDGTDEGIALAKEFGLACRTTPNNLGIRGGLKALAEAMTAEIILIMENDCPLIEPHDEAKRQIELAASAIEAGDVDLVRLRHTRHPGQKFPTLGKYLRYHPKTDAPAGEKLAAALRRAFRAEKARRLAGTSAYVEERPEEKFPDLIRRTEEGYLIVDSACLPWTNQSVMLKRDFFLNTIIARAEAHPAGEQVNGFWALEPELNRSWWRNQHFRIGLDRGLFTHERI